MLRAAKSLTRQVLKVELILQNVVKQCGLACTQCAAHQQDGHRQAATRRREHPLFVHTHEGERGDVAVIVRHAHPHRTRTYLKICFVTVSVALGQASSLVLP